MPHKNTSGNPATAQDDSAVTAAAHAFIAKWSGVTASELATSQSFVIQLCELLGVEAPHPTPEQSYMFERPITFTHGDGSSSPGRVDCYKQKGLPRILETLEALGRAQRVDGGSGWRG